MQLRPRQLLLGGGILAIALTGGVALAATSQQTKTAHHPRTLLKHARVVAHSSAAMPTAVPTDLQNAMAAFQRARTAADAISAANFDAAAAQQQGVNPALSRLVVNTSSMKMWLVPGTSTSCLYGNNGLGGCAPNSVIENRGLVGGIVGSGPQMWFGVLPTQVNNLHMQSTSGATSSVPVNSDGGFQVSNDNESLVFTAADGSPVSFSPAGPGAASTGGPPPCPPNTSWCK